MSRYEAFGRALDRCHSFLERRFLVALLFSEKFTFDVTADLGIAEDANGVLLGQQIPVAAYSVDFAMKRRGSAVRLAIELDGHQFHDSSPQLIARDRVRDRCLTELDWRIIRFTTNELVKDPIACAQQAYNIMMKLSKAPVLAPLAKVQGRQLMLRTGT